MNLAITPIRLAKISCNNMTAKTVQKEYKEQNSLNSNPFACLNYTPNYRINFRGKNISQDPKKRLEQAERFGLSLIKLDLKETDAKDLAVKIAESTGIKQQKILVTYKLEEAREFLQKQIDMPRKEAEKAISDKSCSSVVAASIKEQEEGPEYLMFIPKNNIMAAYDYLQPLMRIELAGSIAHEYTHLLDHIARTKKVRNKAKAKGEIIENNRDEKTDKAVHYIIDETSAKDKNIKETIKKYLTDNKESINFPLLKEQLEFEKRAYGTEVSVKKRACGLYRLPKEAQSLITQHEEEILTRINTALEVIKGIEKELRRSQN